MPPPTPETIPQPPSGRGDDVPSWLEAHGIVPVIPSIRSSDLELIYGSSPFSYYLKRRLGLVPALGWSKALVRGSWFHTFAEHLTESNDTLTLLADKLIPQRLAELRTLASGVGIKGESLDAVIAREEKDARCALGWFLASRTVPITRPGQLPLDPYATYLSRDYWLTPRTKAGKLCTELELTFDHPHLPRTPIIITLDRLLLHTAHNKLWVVDWKSCDEPTNVRLQTCPLEFQTRLYLFVVGTLLENGTLQDLLDIPTSTTLGGMMHIAIQKPTIEFGMNDRDFTLDTSPFKSGPRKGQPRDERIYQGEPKLSNYIKRCTDWYLGQGAYVHKQSEHDAVCPVGISYTEPSVLDDDAYYQLTNDLKTINHYATLFPSPRDFPSTTRAIRQHGKLDAYSPFFLCPPAMWPEIIVREGFIVEHRDDHMNHHEA